MKTLEQRLEIKLLELEATHERRLRYANMFDSWTNQGKYWRKQACETFEQIELLKEIKGGNQMANYYVSFGTGAGDFVAYTTTWAKHLADEKAAYTQNDIKIFALADEKASYTQNDVKPLWVRKWWGIPFDDENACDVDPIKFGEFGYYSDWE